MSNSKNSNLEDVSKGNEESAPRANDSTSNKKTRFTKSESISKVFKELESNQGVLDSEPLEIDENEGMLDSEPLEIDDSSVDEIIPIHNEYRDLDKSEASAEESVEGGVILNPDSDDLAEENVNESIELGIDSNENSDSIDEDDSLELSESIDEDALADEDAFITGSGDDAILADEDIEEKISKPSAQGVLINNKNKTSDSRKFSDIFNSSTIVSIVGFILGMIILLIGISYYASSSDRVVDNVLSGETAGLAIFVVLIGLIIIGFSLLKYFSSSKASLIVDTFNSIKSIDYDEMSEDSISREDFDTLLSIFKRKKDTNFSDDDKSVDSSKDLFEENQNDQDSDDDIDAFYSDSNLTSQKNRSSSKGHPDASSTEISQDSDDDNDEIIPIHSKLNEQSNESDFGDVHSDEPDLEDKYSKYDFEEESDDGYVLLDGDLSDELSDDLADEELEEESDLAKADFNDDADLFEENQQDIIEDQSLKEHEEAIEEDSIEESSEYEDSSEAESDGLEDKYSKYDFDNDSDDEEESAPSKHKFQKSVDLSKFERQDLTEEELAEKQRKAEELAEKKRRIIEGTNFDNSLRKQ